MFHLLLTLHPPSSVLCLRSVVPQLWSQQKSTPTRKPPLVLLTFKTAPSTPAVLLWSLLWLEQVAKFRAEDEMKVISTKSSICRLCSSCCLPLCGMHPSLTSHLGVRAPRLPTRMETLEKQEMSLIMRENCRTGGNYRQSALKALPFSKHFSGFLQISKVTGS